MNKQNLIFIPYAHIDNTSGGVNLANYDKRKETYLKNCCVALVSAKSHNPQYDVALVTNIEIPKYYQDILDSNHILIFQEPFDMFVFDRAYKWNLACYKLNALYKIIRKYEYANYCYLDTDVYVQDSLDNLFVECSEHIMLYDIVHGLGTKDYCGFVAEVGAFLDKDTRITQYGGELFAASRDHALMFSNLALDIFKKIITNDFQTSFGDEFIVSLVANELKVKVKNAAPYIYRFWTGFNFRLVSTCHTYNPVCILHVPAEKEKGMIVILNRYILKNKIPKNKVVHRILSISKRPLKHHVYFLVKYIKK